MSQPSVPAVASTATSAADRPCPPSGGDAFAAELAEHLAGFGADRPMFGELDARIRECLAPAARAVCAPDPRDTEWLIELAAAAATWAREGVELDRVLLEYHEAIRGGLELAAGQHPGEGGVPVSRAETLLRLLQTVTVATTAAFVDEYRFVAREHQTAAQTLVAALLSGHSRSALARQAGIAIAATYQVVALSIPAPPITDDPRVNMETEALRRLRRLQSAFAPVLGSRALSLLTTAGGTILVPCDAAAGRELGDVFAMDADALRSLSEAAAAPLTAVVLSGPADHIPELATRAHELLDLVRALDRSPGVYRMADLAVEYQLTTPGPARDHLAGLLTPIQAAPRLFSTLRAFLASGLDRMETARRLGVHPNSVTHRLRRIHRLTGLDLGCPEGISLARAALLMRTLDLPGA
ncbi:PucR family transcriptional regulator [Nocardia sp. NPDC127526]|uniref:PucR family transcriptional regulator n=1 Tax=Nocardia sp. NPDC127526 TaxID=3345393 RepID=UPI003637C284